MNRAPGWRFLRVRANPRRRLCRLAAVCALGLGGGRVASADVNQAIDATGALFTYLLDTRTPASSALAPDTIAKKPGWSLLREDDTDHAFDGDAVLLNDALALVLRKQGNGAEVYAKGEEGYRLRARLMPEFADGAVSAGLSGLRIADNTPGAVGVEAEYAGAGGSRASVSYRLVTGQPYVQIQPVEGATALAVRLASDYLIVPDFFADDLVYRPTDFFAPRTSLPAENFLMHLVSGGDAIVTCVWQSRQQHAVAICADQGGKSVIEGCDITLADTVSVWIAFLERKGVWHRQDIGEGERAEDQVLAWSPPFPARWRANFLMASEAAESWNFEESRNATYRAPGLGALVYPCWFQSDQAYIRVPPATHDGPAPVLVYPIDRTQGTPLSVFCLVDIMRGTLGVGACQYILDLEGLDAQTSPTPALVIDWVEKQIKAGRGQRSRDKIQERLDRMVEHVTHAHQRIEAYAAFARDMRAETETAVQRASTPNDTEALKKIAGIAAEMEKAGQAYGELGNTPAAAQQESEAVLAALDQADANGKCREIGERLHALGAAQDRALSKGRMAVRRIDQRAMDMRTSGPANADFAKSVHERAAQLLEEADAR